MCGIEWLGDLRGRRFASRCAWLDSFRRVGFDLCGDLRLFFRVTRFSAFRNSLWECGLFGFIFGDRSSNRLCLFRDRRQEHVSRDSEAIVT